ncbi:hypothetical protein ACF0C0_18185 [Pseudomonas aeruginosa]|uniref:hypothetical protein n=1 Tax=Pseudomonas aeruginosa TaxID=287 RepID=UPI000EAC0307|nr:hypothetical protein [Pseudomonas aeruginosa]MBW6372204.1 hypothetical protein [Pseudomonas aeruginosa]MBW6378716.1 hypothetical protein [Pseudomonas aeruginosa]RTU38021.1 hypothetical protein DY973_10690 [Pseudomonas aeruginosa]HCE5868293.1 hypothetical protein [Pseudomonas aeruginosa]HDU8922510.1 hypothetical protein [Pseudomonas aeruginosa]
MAAIDFLRDQGFTVRKVGARVVVGPRGKITDDIRAYVKRYRLALLAELAANDGIERRCSWTVLVPGYRPFTMISPPITRAEALDDVQSRWADAQLAPEVTTQ